MALVDVDDEWVIKLYMERANVEIYDRLMTILNAMMDDGVYTINDCFSDLLRLAEEVRRQVDERKFPLSGLHLDNDGHEQLSVVK